MSENSDYNYENNGFESIDLKEYNSKVFIGNDEDDRISFLSDSCKNLIEHGISNLITGMTGMTDNLDFKEIYKNDINSTEKLIVNEENSVSNENENLQFLNQKRNNTTIKNSLSDVMKNENIKNREILQNKEKKKRGRREKNSVVKGEHTKFEFFNMLHKIKVFSNKCIITTINGFLKLEKKNKTIKKNLGQITKDRTITLNKLLLKTKIKDIISSKISCKFTKYNENYNEQVINDLLLTTSNEKIKYILNLTYENFITNIFSKYNEEEFFQEFNFENKDLFKSINLENKKRYYDIIKDIYKELENKKPRNRKKEDYRNEFILNMKDKEINLSEKQ